jgi:uncharacterized protein DUF1573
VSMKVESLAKGFIDALFRGRFLSGLTLLALGACDMRREEATTASMRTTTLQCTEGGPLYDAGIIMVGQRFEHAFTITNSGFDVERITAFRSSCGCAMLRGSELPLDLQPRRSHKFLISVDTVRSPGPFEARLDLLGANEKTLLTLVVRLRLDVDVNVSFLDPHHRLSQWGEGNGHNFRSTLRVVSSRTSRPAIKEVLLVNSQQWTGRAELAAIDYASMQGRHVIDVPVDIALREWPATGSVDDILEFTVVVDSKVFVARLRVTGNAATPLGLDTAIVYVGIIRPGADLDIEYNASVPQHRLLDVSTTSDWIHCSLVRIDESRRLLRLRGHAPNVSQSINVEVLVSENGVEVQRLPLIGAVR